MCVYVCVCMHAADNEMYILFNVFQMPFSTRHCSQSHKAVPFLIHSVQQQESFTCWLGKKMKEKERGGFPSWKEK